jgi:prolyl-tRNA synthetase
MVMTILQAYHDTYEELLAVPVIKGKKSVDEQFAGAYYTTTTEIYVPVSGRGIQGATSHQLGQNFAKMFDVWFEDQNEQKKFVWQTSWGLSTRSIGAMIMVHSDN